MDSKTITFLIIFLIVISSFYLTMKGYYIGIAHPSHSSSMDMSAVYVYNTKQVCVVGDVCVYETVHEDFGLIAHRVVSVSDNGLWYVFKGDNNDYFERVCASRIRGRVLETFK